MAPDRQQQREGGSGCPRHQFDRCADGLCAACLITKATSLDRGDRVETTTIVDDADAYKATARFGGDADLGSPCVFDDVREGLLQDAQDVERMALVEPGERGNVTDFPPQANAGRFQPGLKTETQRTEQ